MTTNQTIDGVPRELLERIREKLSQTDYTWSTNDPEEELRALLDAPVCKTCCDQGEVPTGEMAYQGHWQPPEPVMVPCPECGGEPAAQPQGEPVKPYGYMFHPDGKKDGEFFIYDAPKERVPDHLGEYWTATPLYAEQPAPVAVVLTDAQILEAMRQPLNDADGGYVVDTAPGNVVAAGRALIAFLNTK